MTRAMTRALPLAVVLSLALAPSALTSQRKGGLMMADALYAAWLEADERVIVQTIGAFAHHEFEEFRNDFRVRVLTAWEQQERQPPQALFALEVAVVARQRGFYYWADFIKQASQFIVRARSEPPGVNPRWDAFELLWHKTAVAFLQGQRRPDLLMDEGIRPLERRIAADPAPPDSRPVLVDPWIELASGVAHESMTIEYPATLADHGPTALAYYEAASAHDEFRPEAAVRSAQLLLRLGRAAEALERLEAFDDTWTRDGVLLYWRRLVAGRALEALGRPDDAVRVYRAALQIAPTAQAPLVAIMALDLRRDRRAEAQEMAATIRQPADPAAAVDPWWMYAHGDYRFFQARLRALRLLVRP
jgi:tetratricopeptide (TPR) repeat protein